VLAGFIGMRRPGVTVTLPVALAAGLLGDPVRLGVLRAQAARRETAGFSREDWALLLSDAEGLKALS